jgi:hypothetical protein
MMSEWFGATRAWLEYLGGVRDTSPSGGVPSRVVFWAILWTAMILWMWIFSGQTSRFIYIDF